jgi:hypothetical protein
MNAANRPLGTGIAMGTRLKNDSADRDLLPRDRESSAEAGPFDLAVDHPMDSAARAVLRSRRRAFVLPAVASHPAAARP